MSHECWCICLRACSFYFSLNLLPITGRSTDPNLLNGHLKNPNNFDVYARRVNSLLLVCSLSSHRHSCTSYLWLSIYWFIHNKKILISPLMMQVLIRYTNIVLTIKSKVGLALGKTTVLRITLNLDGVSIISRTHTYPSHSQTSRLLTSSSLGVPVPRATQCMWGA